MADDQVRKKAHLIHFHVREKVAFGASPERGLPGLRYGVDSVYGHLNFSSPSVFQAAAAELKKKRTFRKFTYRGVDLDQLLDMNNEQLMELFPCRIRSAHCS